MAVAGGGGCCRRRCGFTLIELLIVVAIIAILAAIAVPNFLEAQTRAKVSRVMADLRTIATCLESYAVDHNHYPPNDGHYNVIPIQITTPIAFLINSNMVDPFCTNEFDPVYGILARYYTYDQIVTERCFMAILLNGGPPPPVEAVDWEYFNPNARGKYGMWRLVSNGPDKTYADPNYIWGSDPEDPNGVLMGSDVPYDATNGTVSMGNIIRTQKEPLKE
jgi:prepilin-type N-terminal cleavage/methylation domain-containing protein